jgi:hypothetical protein
MMVVMIRSMGWLGMENEFLTGCCRLFGDVLLKSSVARVELGGVPQFFPEGSVFAGELGGKDDGDGGMEVASFTGFPFGKPPAADSELVAVFAARRDAEFDGAVEGRDGEFGSEHGFPRGEIKVVEEVATFAVEVRVSGVADP